MSNYEAFRHRKQRLQPWTFKGRKSINMKWQWDNIFHMVAYIVAQHIAQWWVRITSQSDKYHKVFLDPARLDYLLHILHVRWISGNRLRKKVNQNLAMCEFTSMTCDRKNTFLWSTHHRIGVYKRSLLTWSSSGEYLSQWLRRSCKLLRRSIGQAKFFI